MAPLLIFWPQNKNKDMRMSRTVLIPAPRSPGEACVAASQTRRPKATPREGRKGKLPDPRRPQWAVGS